MKDPKYSVTIGPGNRIGSLAVGPGAHAEGQVSESTPRRRIHDGTRLTTAELLVEAFDRVHVDGWLYRWWRWDFEYVQAPGGDGWLVSVAFHRPDRDTQVHGEGRSRQDFVRKGATAREAWSTAFTLLKLTLEHELLEAFHVDGKRVFDPHTPFLGKETTG